MNRKLLAAAVLAATSLSATAAFADEAKHGFGFRTPVVVAPRYVAPAPVYRYAAPVFNHRYVPPVSYNHGHRGYWSNGRWIAPVVIGAAVLGTVAAANHYYYNPAPVVTYVNPAPVYGTTYVTAPANCDTFCQADRDQNGVIDKVEASFDRTWEKWFYDIDRNNDGVITRQEIADWNRIRASGRY